MSKTALLEIGTEEIPAGYIEPALEQMKALAAEHLTARGLSFGEIKIFATPRRLALAIEKLSEKSEEKTEELTGPSVKAGRDAQGNFTQAAKGFAAKYGTTPDKLSVKATEKGEYFSFAVKTPGEKTEKILSAVFPEIICRLQFPKSMKWESSGLRFARPVRSVIALYGDKIIKFTAGDVKSSNRTSGLYALTQKKITVSSADKYAGTLKNNCVMADPLERREIIRKITDAAAKRVKGAALIDDDLLNEINFLVEHPVAILGNFDEKYLRLPPEVLITCMRKKQKYFPVVDAKKHLTNSFIGIRNGMSEHQETVREGYERVLEARLEDAEFFYKKDTGSRLDAKIEKLKGVMFQKELGTVYDKMLRVERLADQLLNTVPDGENIRAEIGDLKRACLLAKADLVTEMVFEYPELQGVAGRIYAAKDGESQRICRAIEEHYWPVTADGKLPVSDFALVLSIADKIDTLTGDFAAGLVPSGSADPYGLRRQAAGVVRVIRDKKLPVDLNALVSKAFSFLPEHLKNNNDALRQVMEFLKQRLEVILETGGYKFDEIRAVLAKGMGDIGTIERKLQALKAMRKQPDFQPLITAFKRSANILKQAEKLKLNVSPDVSHDLFREDAERNLYAKISSIRAEIEALKAAKDFPAVLQKMVELKPDVDLFFEKVMVMVEDEKLKHNRLALLKYATGLFFDLMDFSQLQE
ncbi:MAG: glycine--tRNA ligase subunit beta [Elusimicrobiota bacterium]